MLLTLAAAPFPIQGLIKGTPIGKPGQAVFPTEPMEPFGQSLGALLLAQQLPLIEKQQTISHFGGIAQEHAQQAHPSIGTVGHLPVHSVAEALRQPPTQQPPSPTGRYRYREAQAHHRVNNHQRIDHRHMGQLDGDRSIDETRDSHGHRHRQKASQPRIPGKITIQGRYLGKTASHQHDDPYPDIGRQPAATYRFRRQRIDTGDQKEIKQKNIKSINPEAFHGFPALIFTIFRFQAPWKA